MRLNKPFTSLLLRTKSFLGDLLLRSFLGDLLLFDSPQRKTSKSNMSIFAYGYQSARLRTSEIAFGLAQAIMRRVHPDHGKLLSNGMFECRIQISDVLRKAVSETTCSKNPKNYGATRKMASDWPLLGSNFEYRADYWKGSPEIRELTITALEESVGTKFLYSSLSALAGYHVVRSDLSVAIGITRGENSNSQWHLDSFHPVIKGFIAIDDIAEDDAQFQYVISSFNDRQLIRETHRNWIFSKQYLKYGGSPRLSPTQVTHIRKHQIFSMTGHAGTTVFANTSGVHRKGPDQSGRERWQIGLEVRRRGPIQSLSRLVFRTYG